MLALTLFSLHDFPVAIKVHNGRSENARARVQLFSAQSSTLLNAILESESGTEYDKQVQDHSYLDGSSLNFAGKYFMIPTAYSETSKLLRQCSFSKKVQWPTSHRVPLKIRTNLTASGLGVLGLKHKSEASPTFQHI